MTASVLPSRGAHVVLAGFGLTPFVAAVVSVGLWSRRRRSLGRLARRRLLGRMLVIFLLVPGVVLAPAIAQAGLVRLLSPSPAAAQTVIGIVTYTYDDNGNMIGRTHLGNTDTYTWDFENRLAAADLQIGTPAAVDFAYDADGLRTARTANGVTTTYLVDENRPLPQVLTETTGATVTTYTHGADLVSMTRTGTGTRFYLHDGQRSTRQLASAAGAVTDGYTYDAFGVELATTGSTPNVYRYGGEQLDPNVGFYYLRARWYAQAVGRFVSPDPATGSIYDPVSLHRYLYANADPVNNADPTGRFTLAFSMQTIAIYSILGGIAGAIAGALIAGPGQRLKGAAIGFVIGYIITFALLTLVSASIGAAQAAAAAAEVETAAAEAAVQVSSRVGAFEASTLGEVGFGQTVGSGLRTIALRFSTQAGREAFIRALRNEAAQTLVRTRNPVLQEGIRKLQVAIEELALHFGVI
jgi:RHS repeat-associated protein